MFLNHERVLKTRTRRVYLLASRLFPHIPFITSQSSSSLSIHPTIPPQGKKKDQRTIQTNAEKKNLGKEEEDENLLWTNREAPPGGGAQNKPQSRNTFWGIVSSCRPLTFPFASCSFTCAPRSSCSPSLTPTLKLYSMPRVFVVQIREPLLPEVEKGERDRWGGYARVYHGWDMEYGFGL